MSDSDAPDTTQTDVARGNQARQGFAALTGPRNDRDVSRPKASTIKTGSSTKDQAAGGQL
jgi:hypothetical protein